jgi:hypothetical protein
MISYINTTELYQVYNIYCKINNLNLVSVLSQNKINITKLESWNQLFEANQTDLLFSVQSDNFTIFDINDLTLTKEILNLLHTQKNVYIYNSYSKLLANEKKLISHFGGEIVEPGNLSKIEIEDFILTYSSTNNYNMNKNILELLIQLTSNVLELVDIVDFIFLSSDPYTALLSLFKKEQTPIYMLPMRAEKIKDDLQKWLLYLKNDDTQLILSMLFTKLDKRHSSISSLLLKKIIKIDNMIKSQSRLNGVLLLKLFIWETINEKN